MPDTLLADTDIEEALSQAYVTAVASMAGYVVAHKNFDRDGIDITIEAGDSFRPKIDLQLKASINIDDSAETISYFCRKRNYNLLNIATQTPRLLLVMKLPKNREDWINLSSDQLVIRHCAYWMSLRGYPDCENATGQTIYIPTTNRFHIQSLRLLMDRSRSGTV
ncbi:DUF4365 domain-containing protein [Gluconobacter sp. LMG 1744]|uniref:DUF4365 domain-containing protein n=1 Tax=Gluconobacter TaxID=441 RepID=UPI00098A8A24|nr:MULTISPECIES: DUF4365 domain-containing protein [Gluconobacter]MBF0891726.1 DUF4365 domain-containing protein [Gluconobacter cadivus]MBS1076076.1 DUF4365 domain-containing protein [Gluconobacter sp. Dm-73]MBS1092588.1 DUF4365 domain-containing protein [Gluconobacter sp. Dm-74]